MSVYHGPTLLDVREQTRSEAPRELVTIDCSGAYELDDAIGAERISAFDEVYRVGIAVPDITRTYHAGRDDVTDRVIQRGASYYATKAHESYEPMLEHDYTQRVHLGVDEYPRKVMLISFVVGPNTPIQNIDISFTRAQIVENMNYHDFAVDIPAEQRYQDIARAAASIVLQLREDADDIDKVARHLTSDGLHGTWSRGAKVVETHMIGASYIMGMTLAEHEFPAIYRIHDPDNTPYGLILGEDLAYFSNIPGRHKGLGLSFIARAGSPLRRGEDFFNQAMAKKLSNKRNGWRNSVIDSRDLRIQQAIIRTRNQQIAIAQYAGKKETAPSGDTWR